ncbi:SLC25A4S [Lepeophtheirus salmonis]|uniref:ADP/ATP translocase n=1 Tax=Lepeophtheirus salmonis TaxID=72036 RepID=A0A7R8CQT8_LEPSM|nr:SLC25A4S [Lepeophtheirus salmonis]CAF2898361.1 SLC25A4S [Lepeophtheirus salmonis]
MGEVGCYGSPSALSLLRKKTVRYILFIIRPESLKVRKYFFSLSGTAAAVSKTSAAPIERVKLLLQNQNELLKQGKLDSKFTSVKDCALRTLRNEGVLSFWRGNFASVLRYFPQQALNFSFKDQIRTFMKISPKATYSEKFMKNIFSGGLAGSISLCFVQSIDYTRTRLATDRKGQFNGIIDVYVKTLKSDGDCRGLYFGLYDSLKPILLDENHKMLVSFLLGWAVTITSGLIVYPIDTVKRRMMLTSGESVKYSSSLDCFKHILRHEGLNAVYRGAGVNIIRGIAGAGVLSGFDQFKLIYTVWRLPQ